MPLLERETDHGYVCQLGVWYWQCGHKQLAVACYHRSLEIEPEPATYFNLAVCLDDFAADLEGNSELIYQARSGYIAEAIESLRSFYKLVSSPKERSSAEAMLKQNGKEHLIIKAKIKRSLKTEQRK